MYFVFFLFHILSVLTSFYGGFQTVVAAMAKRRNTIGRERMSAGKSACRPQSSPHQPGHAAAESTKDFNSHTLARFVSFAMNEQHTVLEA